MRRRLHRCRLRHEIRAIKTRPNNPLRFLQRKNSIRRYLANGLTCAARKTTFRTQKRFHNKKYTPKSKDQPFESEHTHFNVRFNKSNGAMHHRPTIVFLLSHQITTVQQKTAEINNHINQPEQSIPITTTSVNSKINQKTTTTNNPHNLSIRILSRQTITTNNHDIKSTFSQSKTIRQNKHDIQSNNTPRFLNIKIIAG